MGDNKMLNAIERCEIYDEYVFKLATAAKNNDSLTLNQLLKNAVNLLDKMSDSFGSLQFPVYGNIPNEFVKLTNVFNLSELKTLLAEGLVNVTFVKADGSIRNMKCSTNIKYIPPSKLPDSKKAVEKNENRIHVFDVEKEDWRSFLVENVITFERA